MLRHLVLFVALACIGVANAFPLSALSGTASRNKLDLSATQLLSLHDGTYVVLIESSSPVAELALNPRVLTRPLLSEDSIRPTGTTTIVARVRLTNDSVIWAYAINEFTFYVYAVVDDALGIFVVGDATTVIPGSSSGVIGVLRFSVDGEFVWGKTYTDKTPGLDGLLVDLSSSSFGPFVDLAGPRTLAIAGSATLVDAGLGRSAIFVDTVTREARQVRFPLPDGPLEGVLFTGMAADAASGAACFADVAVVQGAEGTQRLFVQCANAGGEIEVVSRVLVPIQGNAAWGPPNVLMAGGGENGAAVLYVVAIRESGFNDTRMDSDEASIVNEMLLFKLNPTTLEDVEWESGRTSVKPTMRKLLLANSFSGFGGSVSSLEYIRDQNTLVVLYGSGTILSGIETLPDGRIAFRGNSSQAAERFTDRQWLLYFGNDAKPAAVRIPDDPRPNGEQDDSDVVNVVDLELGEDKRDLYLFGSLEGLDGRKRGVVVPFSFPLLELSKP